MEMKPGKYEATISDYGIGATKSGDPQVMILFNYKDAEGKDHEITWYGSLKEKALKITLKSLLTCGFKGNDVSALAEGCMGNALDVNTPVQIDIQLEPSMDGTKSFLRVKWINPLGGAAFRSKFSKGEAVTKLGALNIKGELAALRQEMGVKASAKAQADDFDNLPF